MPSVEKLDLRGVVLPVALLNCSRFLSQLAPHERLEILIRDSEAADVLMRVIARSQDRTVRRVKARGHYRIQVGPVSNVPPTGTSEKTSEL